MEAPDAVLTNGRLAPAKPGDAYDAVVIGGGFYGCAAALFLRKYFSRVLVVEREPDLLCMASYANQARVHKGYHYPRSVSTGASSSANFPRFVAEFRAAIDDRFTKLYALGRMHTKVHKAQFERFCRLIEAPLRPARPEFQRLFEPQLIQAVYETQEYAFSATALREIFRCRMAAADVEVRLGTEVTRVDASDARQIEVELGDSGSVPARSLFNCCYSRLRHIPGIGACRTHLKHEIAELALIEPDPVLAGLGVTVMDGPFFSTMPFPARGLHSLSHVRYTPHCSWPDDGSSAEDPYEALARYPKVSRFPEMACDASRFLPRLRESRHVDSLFTVKSVLVRNEVDDGRPILFERAALPGRVYYILGGKLDNIYDVYERLRHELEGWQ